MLVYQAEGPPRNTPAYRLRTAAIPNKYEEQTSSEAKRVSAIATRSTYFRTCCGPSVYN